MRISYSLSFFLLLLFTLVISCGEKNEPVNYPVNGTVESSDSTEIHYTVYSGGDQALVFVHCWCCDQSYWENQIDEFKKDYQVVTLDLAGHGESGTDRDEWTIEAYGGDVAAVVNKLKLKDVILIGHSMGGMVILEAAKQIPQGVVKALVAVDSYRNLEEKYDKEAQEQFLNSFKVDFKDGVKTFVGYLFADSADTDLVAYVSEDMSSAPEEVGVESMRNIMKYDYMNSFEDINIPVRSINGDKFPTNDKANARVAGDYKSIIIPGTGHFPHIEKPVLFNKALYEVIGEFWKKK